MLDLSFFDVVYFCYDFIFRKTGDFNMPVSTMKLTRFQKGLTQVDLWQLTGIPQWRLSLIERGLLPKGDEADKIAKALGRAQEEIFPCVVDQVKSAHT